MKKISIIGGLVKKIYRTYSVDLLNNLKLKGFLDLRPSYLEVLQFICEHEGPSIKDIGKFCSLKKQTMTSHLNDLEARGYIIRQLSVEDKREQRIYLTEYGLKFKFALFEAMAEIEKNYIQLIGDLEFNRVELMLKNFHGKLTLHSYEKGSFQLDQSIII